MQITELKEKIHEQVDLLTDEKDLAMTIGLFLKSSSKNNLHA
jgi:hypothetical protein